MFKDILQLGNKIQLRQILLNGLSENETFASKLLDIKPDGTVSIAMPIDKGKLVVMDLNAQFEMVFYTDKGLYECKAIVQRRYKTNNIYVAVMSLKTELKKVQRREYYRFDCVTPLKYNILKQEDYEKAEKDDPYLKKYVDGVKTYQDAMITDISGGGIRFHTKDKKESGDYVYMKFQLADTPIKLWGIIVGSNLLDTRDDIYENRVKFVHIEEKVRERIIRYIFEEERKIRQMKKGIY